MTKLLQVGRRGRSCVLIRALIQLSPMIPASRESQDELPSLPDGWCLAGDLSIK